MSEQPQLLYKHRHVPGINTIDVWYQYGGYENFKKALAMKPDAVIEEVKVSGLRGRGGAGFPTHIKWNAVPKNRDVEHYLIINADEGEPGTAKDRDLMNGLPHLLVEGCLISMHAIRASKCYIYIRGEYIEPWKSVQKAINEAYAEGLCGKNVLGSGLDFDIYTHLGAGAYECGEESALMSSLMGERGMPRMKPPAAPLPMISGAWKRPSVVNNVETVATLLPIIEMGGTEYAKIGYGSPRSRGTKLFSISGHVEKPGVYEIVLGTPFSEVLELCGGVRKGHTLKTYIPGGSSMGFAPPTPLDYPFDYEGIPANTKTLGLGSGGLIIFDETTPIVPITQRLVDFYHHESCGKCTPCREGLNWLSKIYRRIVAGAGKESDVDLIWDICDSIRGKSFCALGEGAIWPVMTSLLLFRDEYLAYIRGGKDAMGDLTTIGLDTITMIKETL
ncbi:NADH-quinone oxidoreductase subunit NuoF [Armatimonas sp.]|uniref:NADH-quinone oxidoreductase subunit NuoF n=1 Tax=Armatimonas sp. TaxID=1872638 RepID=UPI003750EC55